MKKIKISRSITLFSVILIAVFIINAAGIKGQGEKNQKVEFRVKKSEQKVDVMVGGRVVTSYCWPDNVYKPVLYPVYTLRGYRNHPWIPAETKGRGERRSYPPGWCLA